MPGLRVLTHAGSIYSLLITNRVPIHYLMWVKSIQVVLVESRLEPSCNQVFGGIVTVYTIKTKFPIKFSFLKSHVLLLF